MGCRAKNDRKRLAALTKVKVASCFRPILALMPIKYPSKYESTA
jgi:hypothetical protein